MIRVNAGLTYFLWIKLLKLGENGKTIVPPCEMEPQICINLDAFIETWRQEEENLYQAEEAVREALEKIQKAFDCPLGWFVAAVRPANPLLLHTEKKFSSREFCYSPANDQTAIDLEFINGWLYEEVDIDEEDFSDLYLDDDDRAAIAQIENN